MDLGQKGRNSLCENQEEMRPFAPGAEVKEQRMEQMGGRRGLCEGALLATPSTASLSDSNYECSVFVAWRVWTLRGRVIECRVGTGVGHVALTARWTSW